MKSLPKFIITTEKTINDSSNPPDSHILFKREHPSNYDPKFCYVMYATQDRKTGEWSLCEWFGTAELWSYDEIVNHAGTKSYREYSGTESDLFAILL